MFVYIILLLSTSIFMISNLVYCLMATFIKIISSTFEADITKGLSVSQGKDTFLVLPVDEST